MPTEKRTRVEMFFPLRSDLANYEIVTKWLAEEFAFSRGGATLTTPFTGLFASANQADLVSDAIRILFCDFDINLDITEQSTELLNYLENIRKSVMILLEEEEIWIIYYPITRVTG